MTEKMTCYYDAEHKLINIGEWDYMKYPIYDNDGFIEEIVDGNPLPDGAYSKKMYVVLNEDGSRAVVDL
ncbi:MULTISPECIES: hypothetical protein [unclassified Leclercia]|uniref:Uncharacterized protein n=1 Tax=Leclercia barmai TaxID=2785629 RepID=A0ABS7RS58_9ENTR|nr:MULTISPECIES: hypothetical protein [unclassified Leclercia]MBZ0057151.1 hypothetical protein [Leclercia sp. EMC7]MCM5695326.1 hypothetical protein [Leclercia sp. LTM01]MCM5699733.1 hypothetical protein [Leclercia sp. LTM14]